MVVSLNSRLESIKEEEEGGGQKTSALWPSIASACLQKAPGCPAARENGSNQQMAPSNYVLLPAGFALFVDTGANRKGPELAGSLTRFC